MKTNANRTVSAEPNAHAAILKVYGIENLRIADGSIMPRVMTSHFGERAGQILKADHKL
jgi:hypothetical protein